MSADFLFELSVEEIPRLSGLKWLENLTHILSTKFSYKNFKYYISHKRMGFIFQDVVIEESKKQIIGPKGADCTFTQSQLSFLESKNIKITEVYFTESYQVAYKISEADYLVNQLMNAISNIDFSPKMSWKCNTLFMRPVRSITTWYDGQYLKFRLGKSSIAQFGEAWINQFPLIDARSYEENMKRMGCIIDQRERKELIQAQLKHSNLLNPSIIDELAHLEENPVLLECYFDSTFLKIDLIEIFLIILSKKLLLLFCYDQDGKISNQFFTIIGQQVDPLLATEGWKRQLNNALNNLLFLIQKDDNQLHMDKLDTISFFNSNLLERTKRVTKLSKTIALFLGINDKSVEEISQFIYADAANFLVQEYPDMEGIIAHHYLKKTHPHIADEVLAVYLGKAETKSSLIVNLAKELDYIFYIASSEPQILIKASINDPYGCRKSAHQIFLSLKELPISLTQLLTLTHSHYEAEMNLNGIQDFLLQRAYAFFNTKQITYESINQFSTFYKLACLINQFWDEAKRLEKLEKRLSKLITNDGLESLSEDYILDEKECTIKEIVNQLEKQSLIFILEHSILIENKVNLFLETNIINSEEIRVRTARYSIIRKLLQSIRPITQVSQFFSHRTVL